MYVFMVVFANDYPLLLFDVRFVAHGCETIVCAGIHAFIPDSVY